MRFFLFFNIQFFLIFPSFLIDFRQKINSTEKILCQKAGIVQVAAPFAAGEILIIGESHV
jgi:hypothetical protein